MPANAYRESERGDLPLDLQLDLLVDAELAEDQRRELLLALERDPKSKAWRELAIRFLQRQVEQQSVQQLMHGGSVIPVELVPTFPQRRKMAFSEWLGAPGTLAVAAGMLIALTSATVTFYVMRPLDPTQESSTDRMVSLPGQTMGLHQPVPVSLPMVAGGHENASDLLFRAPAQENGSGGGGGVAKRSVVIQPDKDGNAFIIPVNTMTMKVY